MNKSELAKAVAEKCDTTPKQAVAIIDAAFDVIADTMKSKDSVTLAGFGTFATKDRAAREGINPATKEKIQIPAKTVAVFKPAKPLKEL
ncbi:MAG: DNA-binding protein [Ponticaulis sp.]|nr:DNA-binding protein [Ponticaulis sp.]